MKNNKCKTVRLGDKVKIISGKVTSPLASQMQAIWHIDQCAVWADPGASGVFHSSFLDT